MEITLRTDTQKVNHQQTNFNVEGQSFVARLFNTCVDSLFTDVGCSSIFQSKNYHTALELAPPDEMDFWYIRLERDGEIIGMLSFQVKSFNPGESLKKHAKKSLLHKLRYGVASLIDLPVLCLGNTTVTGDYGFCFANDVPSRMQTLLMMNSIEWMLSLPEFKRVKLIFIKDFYEDIFKEIPGTSFCKQYHPIDTQPSMIMNLPAGWKSYEDYLKALKSKYRVRANKAHEVAHELEKVELSADEIVDIEPYLHQLYLGVVGDVGFNLFILAPNYFSTVKRALGDKFHLWVYKYKGDVVSFFTVFEDGDILDAHFLGYDPEVNHRFKMYMNMLLAMIGFAIEKGFRQLQLSRTAAEIKSSVGAQGIPVWAYLRLRSRPLNAMLPRIYSFFKPDLSWVPREPFR